MSEAFQVDARGLKCPWPALRLARAMRDHHRVDILVDDPLAESEIASLSGERGWNCIIVEEEARIRIAVSG